MCEKNGKAYVEDRDHQRTDIRKPEGGDMRWEDNIEESHNRQTRGPHKARASKVESGAVIMLGCQYVSFKGESYFKHSNRNMIPKKWQDIYEWVAGGIASLVWREALARRAPDTHMAGEKQRRSFHSSKSTWINSSVVNKVYVWLVFMGKHVND